MRRNHAVLRVLYRRLRARHPAESDRLRDATERIPERIHLPRVRPCLVRNQNRRIAAPADIDRYLTRIERVVAVRIVAFLRRVVRHGHPRGASLRQHGVRRHVGEFRERRAVQLLDTDGLSSGCVVVVPRPRLPVGSDGLQPRMAVEVVGVAPVGADGLVPAVLVVAVGAHEAAAGGRPLADLRIRPQFGADEAAVEKGLVIFVGHEVRLLFIPPLVPSLRHAPDVV